MRAVLDLASLDTLPPVKGWLTYANACHRVMKMHAMICRKGT